jgi:hypothetical protein
MKYVVSPVVEFALYCSTALRAGFSLSLRLTTLDERIIYLLEMTEIAFI